MDRRYSQHVIFGPEDVAQHVIFGPEDVAVLYGWEQETTSRRWIARVSIKRSASSFEVIDFWVDGSAVPRIRSFAQSGPTQSVDEKVKRALTMVIQDRIRVAFDEGELFGPVGLAPEEIGTAIDYAKAAHDLDTAAVPETRLWPIES
jgi:hypothetical protein